MEDKTGVTLAQFAMDRMSKAHKQRKGVRLSWKELDSFSRTFMGEMWDEENPEKTPNKQMKLMD